MKIFISTSNHTFIIESNTKNILMKKKKTSNEYLYQLYRFVVRALLFYTTYEPKITRSVLTKIKRKNKLYCVFICKFNMLRRVEMN